MDVEKFVGLAKELNEDSDVEQVDRLCMEWLLDCNIKKHKEIIKHLLDAIRIIIYEL